jgi:hypothetical protein
MEDTIIKRFKSYIEVNDLSGARDFLVEIQDETYVPWDYVYQKVYLHACLRKRVEFVKWMDGLFTSLSPIEQLALRQMFAYGRYLLNK